MERSQVDDVYLKEIEEARRELRSLIYKNRCPAPLMLRLAWQDAGTYDPGSKIAGGPNGSIKSEHELKRPETIGLDEAIKCCEEVKGKLSKVSYADLYQLAGVVAVEVTGGPTVDFVPGRLDLHEPTQDGRLPDPNLKSNESRRKFSGASTLRDIFITRMGLTDQDIVALSGAHTLGEAHENYSGGKGKWTKNPLKFDNSYFVELLRKDESLFRLPTDNALVEDRKFRKYVEKYARDEDAFFEDYAAAHKKLSELGCNLKVAPEKPKLIKSKGVIGIVIVSAVLLAKMYLGKRKNTQLKK